MVVVAAVVVAFTVGFACATEAPDMIRGGEAWGISPMISTVGSTTVRSFCACGMRGGDAAGGDATAEVGSGFVTVYTNAPVAAKPALQINVVIVMMVARVMHPIKQGACASAPM